LNKVPKLSFFELTLKMSTLFYYLNQSVTAIEQA